MFTRDDESRAALQSLGDDWRFARVSLEVVDGDVDTAISTFQTIASPDLIIIQTDVIDDTLTERLEALSGHCSEGTGAIVIGPVNDVNLYRKLINMGISDYLVRPVTGEQLGQEITETLIEQIGAAGSRLIAVAGAKGGVGTTAISEALAWALSENMNQKTFLIDAAGGWSSLSVGMNFEPATTLSEAARAAVEGNEDGLSRMIFQASERLFILSSGGDVMLEDLVAPENYEILIDHLMSMYPVVIVDLSGATPGLKRCVFNRAHQILLVTAPVLTSVRACRSLMQEIKSLRGGSDEDIEVILNMQGMAARHEVPKNQIEEGLERKLSSVLPFDPALFVSVESESRKLHEDKAGKPLVDKLMPIVVKVLNISDSGQQDGDKKGGLGQFFSRLTAKG